MTFRNGAIVATAAMLLVAVAGGAERPEVTATIDRIAVHLDGFQVKDGPLAGHWVPDWGFDGSIAAGMVQAYLYTGEPNYKTAAELGGEFILCSASDNYLGDEAYALMLLSAVADDPASNPWRAELASFYEQICSHPDGIHAYTDWYSTIDPSVAVFYLAHHAVAAQYVDAACAEGFRQELMVYLSSVTDEAAAFPVMALGVATWALAQTGPLDTTPIGSGPDGAWEGVTVADLPALVMSHQVPPGQDSAGCFYRRLDHAEDDAGLLCGYTEDAVYAVLGLQACAAAGSPTDVSIPVRETEVLLLAAPDADGVVCQFLDQTGSKHPVYAGELLQALATLLSEKEETADEAEAEQDNEAAR